jgi:hypothetical protein
MTDKWRIEEDEISGYNRGKMKVRKRSCWFNGVHYPSTKLAIEASGLNPHQFYRHPTYKTGFYWVDTIGEVKTTKKYELK